jgi:hypothetical protein
MPPQCPRPASKAGAKTGSLLVPLAMVLADADCFDLLGSGALAANLPHAPFGDFQRALSLRASVLVKCEGAPSAIRPSATRRATPPPCAIAPTRGGGGNRDGTRVHLPVIYKAVRIAPHE